MKKKLFFILVFTAIFLINCGSAIDVNKEKEDLVEEKETVLDDKDDTPSQKVMTLGTYAGLPRLGNGRTDIPKLISQLNELNANTYNWLIWRGDKDWDDLILFLPEAKKHNISVWVTLVPPSESKPRAKWNSEPYGMDYIRWSKEIAQLSVAYPNLIALSIDDFASNRNTYTPEYLKKMINEIDKFNSDLSFIPCIYYQYFTPEFVESYVSLIDGILFPYMAKSEGANLKNPNLVKNEIAQIRSSIKEDLPIYIDVYLTGHSAHGETTPSYVETVIKEGGKYADGVLIYTHPLPNSEKGRIVKEEFGRLKMSSKQ
ncbi:MAG: hypothetical protein PHI32_04215 [Dysgonamonadaceae bacterium]|nr:hypothetical protein [Dysgonamonadaceae bacterium]MDD4728776.1 hypothetical protein [Dysgonamonadaceae bacterium]